MGKTGDSLRELLAQAATVLGLKPSEAKRLEAIQAQLRVEKRRYGDKVDDLKDEIRRLEDIARRKKREMDESRGATKRVLAREIETLLRERNGLREKESLWFSRLEKVTLLLRKMELAAEVETAETVDLEDLADVASDRMEDLIDIEKRADRAAEELERIEYREPERDSLDIDQELDVGADESSLLSDQAMKDLAELEEPERE